jgi:soluble lytic murein transglycosylase-like protein
MLGVALVVPAGLLHQRTEAASARAITRGTLAAQSEAAVQTEVREKAREAAERAAWQLAFDRRQAALEARRTLLAQRITSEYQVAPQAAVFLVRESEKAADSHHVDPVLLMAIVGVESRFNPYIMSSSGAIGLTQTMPSAHPGKVSEIRAQGASLVEPEANLHVGASILAEYLALSHGDATKALQRYNGAAGDAQAKYAKKVLRVYGLLHNRLPTIPEGPDTPPPSSATLVARA